MGYKPPYTITSKILNLVVEITEEIVKLDFLEKRVLTPKLRKINRIKTLAGTLEIEGNYLGEEKITAILEGKRVLGTMREVAEANGAIKAYDNLENYNYKSLEDLLLSHKFLMDEVLKEAGSFRRANVGVGGEDGVTHIAPPFGNVPKLMEDLFSWLHTTEEHPLIVSSIFHYEFEFIHPFIDGNGRVGRLWQSVILYNHKNFFSAIPTESIVRDYQEQYYQALEDSSGKGESTPFIEFMLESILKALKKIVFTEQVTEQQGDQVKKLLEVMDESWFSSKELMEKISLKHRPTFRKNYLDPALENNLVEMKDPKSPKSPKQKYRKVSYV